MAGSVTKKVPSKALKGVIPGQINVAKDGDTVKLWTVLGGKVYELAMIAQADAPASGGSGGTTDHAALDNLAYSASGHTGFVADAVLTTKGDIFVRTSSAIARQAVGADNKPLVADAAQTNGLRYGGKILVDEAEIDADLNHDGNNVGFYNVTPVARPSAYTQTYSTATRTHSNPTASALTDNSGGSANTTIQAMSDPADTPLTADILRDDLVANFIAATRNNIADLTAQVNALIVDLANLKQVVNQVIDDHQANGLLQ